VASADVAARALMTQQKRLEAAAESSLETTDSRANPKTVMPSSQPEQMGFSFEATAPRRTRGE